MKHCKYIKSYLSFTINDDMDSSSSLKKSNLKIKCVCKNDLHVREDTMNIRVWRRQPSLNDDTWTMIKVSFLKKIILFTKKMKWYRQIILQHKNLLISYEQCNQKSFVINLMKIVLF